MELSTPVSIRLLVQQREMLKKRAEELGVSETVAIRLAVAFFLSEKATVVSPKSTTHRVKE